MSLRPSLLALALAWLLPATASLGDEEPAAPATTARRSIWIIPHTHWEGAVFKTREEYLDAGLPNIIKALQLLKANSEYRFVLDQVAYVKPFLERYPEHEADFRRFIREGRLELVLGLDIMPDVNMPGGETFVRQMQYGQGYYREKLGVDVQAAWLLDTFGHHAQIPQLLRQGGYSAFWFMRGVPSMDQPSEFLWEGIDGSRIPAFWLTQTYSAMHGAPREIAAFREFIRARAELLSKNQEGPELVGLAGVDVGDPEAHLPEMVRAYNKLDDVPVTVRFTVPSEFEAVVARRAGERPVFRGELNPIFQGIYSSRIELKQRMRDLERRLTAAEKLSVLGAWLGMPGDPEGLWRAWEPVLFNETHDLASGVMTDHVYEDTVRGYDFSRRLADERIAAGLETLASQIDTSGEGAAVLVFNPLGWSRSDAVEVTVGFDDPGVAGLTVLDPEGREVPSQRIESTRYGDGGLKTARIAFIAREVPALGHGVFHVVPRNEPGPPEAQPSDSLALENDLYQLTIDKTTGALTSLQVKAGNWEVLAGRGNVVAREEDKGDLWELYRGLDGGSRIAMTTRQAVPEPDRAKLSDQFSAEPGVLSIGLVFSEFRVAHPLDNGSFSTTVRLYRGLRRIEFLTALVNQEKYVRYQVLFPTTIAGGRNVHEIPFGAIERPAGIEFPAQNWVDHGNGRRGVALLNVGLPGNVTTDATMMLSLLRSHNLGRYGFGGGYEPGMSSESGFQIGIERTMKYALVPHEGDWKSAGVFRDGLEFNHPLIVRKAATHPGPLPKRWGLLEVSSPQVVVSSLKPGRDGTAVIRVYEATGQPAPRVELTLPMGLAAACETDLLEADGRALPVEGGVVLFELKPFEIKTIRLRLSDAPH